MIAQKISDSETEHASMAYFSSFDRELRAVDPSFWKIVDGARQPDKAKLRPYAYCCQGEMSEAIVKNQKIAHYLFSKALKLERERKTPEVDIPANSNAYVESVGADICVLGAFRSSKNVISIDSSLELALQKSLFPPNLPSSAYLNLPSWSVFLNFGKGFRAGAAELSEYAGAFVTILDHPTALGQLVVKVISTTGRSPITITQSIRESGSIVSDWFCTSAGDGLEDDPAWRRVLQSLVNYVASACLYLISKKESLPPGIAPPQREKSFFGLICKDSNVAAVTLATEDLREGPATWHFALDGVRTPGMQAIENVRRLKVHLEASSA